MNRGGNLGRVDEFSNDVEESHQRGLTIRRQYHLLRQLVLIYQRGRSAFCFGQSTADSRSRLIAPCVIPRRKVL